MKTALIVGMARSGIASAKLLAAKGYRIIINDIRREIPGLFESLCGIQYVNALGAEPGTLLAGVDLMVLSPVIPIFAPFAREAERRGIEVIGEIELGYRFSDRGARFVCISGTNGKTTTTALTGEIFKAAGERTFVLGNIGVPIADKALDTREGDAVVAEVAALQLESIKQFRPNAFGMLNISEDHLNRFEYSMENYIAAKQRGFENQTDQDFAVLNYDDSLVRDMNRLTKAKTLYFSSTQEVEEGAYISEGVIKYRINGVTTPVIPVNGLRIPGEHNIENALCATALSMCMGLPAESVRDGLRRFNGVEHRIEFVRELNGVRYINDSKATNPDSAIKAVQAMKWPTVLLLGVGEYDKQSDFRPLFRAFGETVKGVVASGVNARAILEAAEETGFKNIRVCDAGLEEMVAQAASMAGKGGAVLLSPAAASWGAFDDFEHRGREFKRIVNGLH